MKPLSSLRLDRRLTAIVFLLLGTQLSAQEHPSLFFTVAELPAIKENIASSEWMREAYEILIAQADEQLAYPPEPYAYRADDFPGYAFGGGGDWKKSGILGRILEKRVGTLGVAGYLSGDHRYFDKAIEVMVAAAEASEPEEWFSHLQHGDAARGYAIGYDLLYPHMDERERNIVREELEKVATLLYDYRGVWSRADPAVESQNHTAVHYGALGLCALAVGDKPQWQEKATDRIRAYVNRFVDSTGYGTEGVDYTNYGLLGVVPYAVALQRATGEDLVGEQPAMPLIPDQMVWKMLPWGKEVIAMNDNPTTLGSSAGLMYLISRYRLREALWAWLQIEGEAGGGFYGGGRPSHRGDNRPSIGDGLSLPFVLLWGDAGLEPRMPNARSHHFSSGRVFMRDGWGDSLGTQVSFTSGVDYHHAHNHSDENAFTFSALGEEFAIDPGRFPWNTRSHNTVLVNGIGQIRGYGRGRILEYEERDSAVYVKGDAREAFERDSSSFVLSQAQRQLLYVPGEQPYLLIVDDLQTEDKSVNEYTWLLHTDTSNTLEILPEKPGARIVGARRGALCDVDVLWPKTQGTVRESDLSDAYLPGVKNISDSDRRLAKHFRELSIKTSAVNPHFVTLLTARENGTTPPRVATAGNADRLEVRLSFSNGRQDTLVVTPENVRLTRTTSR
ncbi:hypothetical protein GGR28_001859 [Lewinella aquimaris]|uniref:Heparinase II/III-like C-terminal domain-containing protein n=1 Tax=Neolewinella aquimaris TaxID=1835722 RepID=A0A840EBR4_9BACT|nr:heparinase II/III family protein [Neolewinella aquimaris]MBB4079239.1 hypothetical protein [Neolewinella aquimaris]